MRTGLEFPSVHRVYSGNGLLPSCAAVGLPAADLIMSKIQRLSVSGSAGALYISDRQTEYSVDSEQEEEQDETRPISSSYSSDDGFGAASIRYEVGVRGAQISSPLYKRRRGRY
eukprot:ANDGO_00413.mRNA.1 hypothetical protein